MAMTEMQEMAIKARGKVLVSASAGSGKTTVMIKRLADIICGGASLDNVLAVTFTKKAAAQMREKLRSELVSRLSGCDGAARENIRVQLGKINSADISTIDAFCARLVRTYFYAFDGLDASFEIAADDAEVNRMRARAMDNLFDRLYGKGDSPADGDFIYVLERLKKNRSDKTLREMIISAHSRLRIEPDYLSVEDKCAKTFGEGGFDRVCARIGEIAGKTCAYYAQTTEEFAKGLHFASGGEKYAEVLRVVCDNLKEVAKNGDIFSRPLKLSPLRKPSVKDVNREEDARFDSFLRGLKDKYDALFGGIGSREEEERAFYGSGLLARAFAKLVLQFDGEYAAIKREEGKLDYGDLEHLAYALVCGEGADKDVGEQIRSKYSYVFIDEYQDVNPIQDAIICAVAGGDLFKVGDLKQAIYGFRGSRSHFFSGQIKSAESAGGCIILPHNFRSDRAIVDCVNELFSLIMRDEVCGFDYIGGGHTMAVGDESAPTRGKAELCYFSGAPRVKSGADGVYSITEEFPGNAPQSAESAALVKIVREALESFVYDKELKKMRPVKQGDICILVRKKNKKSVAEARRILLSMGYRVDGSAEANVCDYADIKRMIAILSYIDNGEQDAPLVASLLSPLGDMDEDELSAVRVYGGTGRDAPPFRRCAEKYAREKDDGISAKLNAFYARAARLRGLAEGLDAARLIDEIISVGGFAAYYADGVRRAALRRLQSEASAGGLSLNAFLARLKAADYKVKMPLSSSSDSIKIMTMHASKGLEFPVVIIADIAAGFRGDEKREMTYDDEFGFAPDCFDIKERTYRGTVLKKLCSLRASAEELRNEINLFYVACTRAENSLYIMCGKQDKYDAAGALTAPCYAAMFDAQRLEKLIRRNISADECQNAAQSAGKIAIGGYSADKELYAELERSFAFAPVRDDLPVKSSATRILGLSEEDAVFPVIFGEESGPKPDTESGLAYHAFLQYCDFSEKTAGQIEKRLRALEEGGLISKERAALLDVDMLARILALPCFSRLGGREIYREREFLCSLTPEEYLSLVPQGMYSGQSSGGSVIVQGAIDLLAVHRESGKVVRADIIDYKFSSRTDGALKQRYAPQLALYKKVVARIYRIDESRVTTSIINIRACSEIPV